MAAKSNLSIIDNINDDLERLKQEEKEFTTVKNVDPRFTNYNERILGKGLNMPNNPTNSGARKILYSTQSSHIVPIVGSELAYLQTGYENRYGDESSSVLEADYDGTVCAIISKFSKYPKQNYYIVVRDDENKLFRLYHRYSYEHTSESYGYIYNTSYMDSLYVGSVIKKGTILRKSTSYDDYNNRIDGINARVAYIGKDTNTEDSMNISESFSKKAGTRLIHKFTISKNTNDIPLNMYGDKGVYKCLPDMNQEVKNGIVYASRAERRDSSLYAQSSYERMSKLMISDERWVANGRLVDITVWCNDPDSINNDKCSQIYEYYMETRRFCTEIMDKMTPLLTMYPDYSMEHSLQKLMYNSKAILDGAKYGRDQKKFADTQMEIVLIEEVPLRVGDKMADRYGGKGVISKIIPDEEMPMIDGEHLDILLSPAGCPNRENLGQLIELSNTFVGSELIKNLRQLADSANESNFGEIADQCMQYIIQFINCIVPEEAISMSEDYNKLNGPYEKATFVCSILEGKCPVLSTKPITDCLGIDDIEKLYDTFPWIKPVKLQVPMRGSNGKVRYVEALRPVVPGLKYMHRLKQYAEEKFSAVSLSSVNIKNQNVKSKAYKNYKAKFANTSVQLGGMEEADLFHIGAEEAVIDLLIHSVSPLARRNSETMLTNDPTTINIKLPDDASNRSAEIVNTYFKTIGIGLRFSKAKKVKKALISVPLINVDKEKSPLITLLDPNTSDEEKKEITRIQCEKIARKRSQLITPRLIVTDESLDPITRMEQIAVQNYFDNKDKIDAEEQRLKETQDKLDSILDEDDLM